MERFRQQSLQEFSADPEAPDGAIYFIEETPVAQIHYFPEFYTLFWLGEATAVKALSTFQAVLEESEEAQALATEVKKTTVGLYGIEKERTRQVIQEVDTDLLNSEILSGSIPQVMSCYFGLEDDGIEKTVQVWADTSESSKEEKEVGITSSFPLPPTIKRFMNETSSVLHELSDPELEEFFGMIARDIASYGFVKQD